MRVRSVFSILLAAPLMLVNLGLLALAAFLLFWALSLVVPSFPTLWPLTLGVAASAGLYVAGLVFIAADTLEGGLHHLRTPNRILRCSFLGLAMNIAGVLLGIVIILATLAFIGATLY